MGGGPSLHGPDPGPHPAKEGMRIQCLLWLLVLGHVTKPRLEMLRTSLPLHPIPVLPPGDGGEGAPWERGQEPVMFPVCLGGKVVWTGWSQPPFRCLEVTPMVGKSLLLC